MLTTQQIQDVGTAARSGLSRTGIAGKYGLPYTTLHEWLAVGEAEAASQAKGEPPSTDTHITECHNLYTTLAQKEAAYEEELANNLKTALTDADSVNIRAVMFALERRYPERWGKDAEQLRALALEHGIGDTRP